ncbi:MAG: hypothetical protein ACRD19_16960 [Terriglobia bacterium]
MPEKTIVSEGQIELGKRAITARITMLQFTCVFRRRRTAVKGSCQTIGKQGKVHEQEPGL